MILKQARKLVVFVIGATVVLIGVIMFVTPGPALIVIPVGLAILATEFVWARVLLKRMRDQTETMVKQVAESVQGRGKKPPS